MSEKLYHVPVAHTIVWLAGFLVLSGIYVIVSMVLICELTMACTSSFFTLDLNHVVLFNSDPFAVSSAGMAGIAFVFFFGGLFTVLGYGLIEIVFMPAFTRDRSIRDIYGRSRCEVFAWLTVTTLYMLVITSIFVFGAWGQWLFWTMYLAGIFLGIEVGAGVVIFGEWRFHTKPK